MRRMERRRAEVEGQAPRTLQEVDYLLLVDDEARAGALRFAEQEGGPVLRQDEVKRIPPLVELPRLLAAAQRVIAETDTVEDLRLLFAPGSSLGGARPKASVREKAGPLAIAKFPRKDDEINTVLWEAVAFTRAQKAGIQVPVARVETVARKPVLLLRRFERDGKRRIPVGRCSEDIDIFLDPTAFQPTLGKNSIDRELKKLRDSVRRQILPTRYPNLRNVISQR